MYGSSYCKLDKGGNMAKLINDKYYTPKELAKYCIEKTYEIIGENNISEVIEPSAGNGSFSNLFDSCVAYDIEPESENIIQQDFLALNIKYKPCRLIIGNPPYGHSKNILFQKFFKKSIEIADYIAFILPISQLNNSNTLYEFDLIHSEDLGVKQYSDRNLRCCFNIYRRPVNGSNQPTRIKLNDITIMREDSKKFKETTEYDIRMCYWGDGSAGKILNDNEHYAAEYKIIINNSKLKNKIIEVLHKVNWHQELNKISMLKIQQFHLCNVLKKYIPEIQ